MRRTNYLLKTQKELPAQEDSKNAELLIRGGFIRKEMAGVYSFLPLGLRVLRNIEQIVREEMDRVSCHELFLPTLATKESWEATGRWDGVDVLYKVAMANGKEVALAPTHEETVTPLVQAMCRSYKDFPVAVYQIQTKFRNEPRAKSGILRGREFLMKDAYSFHLSQACFEKYYEVQKQAYIKVFERLGLGDITHVVAASGGDFSKYSHEFQTRAENGEDTIFYDSNKNEYYNKEIVETLAPPVSYEDDKALPLEDVEGKGIIGVEELAEYLKIPVEKTTKTLLYEDESGNVIAAAVRGGYQINEFKLKNALGCKKLQLASEATVKKVTKADVGYAGMLNLPKDVKQIWDESCAGRMNFEMGANKTHYHTINVNFDRDIPLPEQFHDIKVGEPGDLHPETKKPYETFRAIEVGNIFPLSTKFSDAFNFRGIHEEGKEVPVIMGCYGIGISRLMGTLAEIFHDEKGLAWPAQVAPFDVYLAPIGKNDEAYQEADKLYEALRKKGVSVLYDDRQEKKVGPGEKFADHELLGIPVRVVVSERTLEKGEAEVVHRDGKTEHLKLKDLVGKFS